MRNPNIGFNVDSEILSNRDEHGSESTRNLHDTIAVERQPGPPPPVSQRSRHGRRTSRDAKNPPTGTHMSTQPTISRQTVHPRLGDILAHRHRRDFKPAAAVCIPSSTASECSRPWYSRCTAISNAQAVSGTTSSSASSAAHTAISSQPRAGSGPRPRNGTMILLATGRSSSSNATTKCGQRLAAGHELRRLRRVRDRVSRLSEVRALGQRDEHVSSPGTRTPARSASWFRSPGGDGGSRRSSSAGGPCRAPAATPARPGRPRS